MILKKGMKGKREIKLLLEWLCLIPDGIFGDLTEEAVKKFQKLHGLTVDGIVGDITYTAIKKSKSKPTSTSLGILHDCLIQKTTRSVKFLIVHCTATKEGLDVSVNDIRQWHKNQGWSDIGYHYVIYRDGTIHEGRPLIKIGSHCTGYNTDSIGIVYVGGVDKNNKAKDTRTPELTVALRDLIKKLLEIYNIPNSKVFCHNQFASKACPSFSPSVLLALIK